jgi:hypothetical protein
MIKGDNKKYIKKTSSFMFNILKSYDNIGSVLICFHEGINLRRVGIKRDGNLADDEQ